MTFIFQLKAVTVLIAAFGCIIPISIITFREVREILKGGEEYEEPIHQYMSHDL